MNILKKVTIHFNFRIFFFFLLVLSYFYCGNSWYEPARLIIHGQVITNNDNALLRVRWNSGEGFNGYEQREFHPVIKPLDAQRNYKLTFGATGKKSSASLSKDVVCTSIIVDGEQLDLTSLQKNIPYSDAGLHFGPGETLSLTIQANAHIGIKFQTNNHSGVSFISVNGVDSEYDLYMANEAAKYRQFDYWLLLPDGSFTVEMDMPRYAVHVLEITNGNVDQSVQLLSAKLRGKGQTVDLMRGQSASLGSVSFFDVMKSMRAYFYPFHFGQQICFALMTTWLLSSLFQFYKKTGGGLACFFEEKRFVFWALFGSSLIVFGTWLVAFWPGVMSVDSLKVWRAAMLPDVYLNDHPVLNVIFYKYLYQLWSNQAVVPLVQVILMALLFSWFIFWLYRQGVSLTLLVPCFLFAVCSVPVGVYNIMLWKDIPFALLVVFWACTLVKLYRERVQGDLRWSAQKIVAFILLGLSIGLVRHNGLVYLIVLPAMFVVLRLVPMKKTVVGMLALILMAGIGFTVLNSAGKISGTEFISHEIHLYAGGASVQNVVENSGRMMSDYMTVLDINQTKQKWDKFHYYFKDRYAYWFLLHSGWWDLFPYQKGIVRFPALRQTAMQIYENSYQKPWVWLSWNPIWLLGLLPVVTLLFWWFPHTAILGVVLLAGALPLVYLRIFDWRYYYFLYLGLLVVLPLMSFDLILWKTDRVR